MTAKAREYAAFRLPKTLKEKVLKIAKGERRSQSQMLQILVEEAVEHRESAESLKSSEQLIAGSDRLPLNQ